MFSPVLSSTDGWALEQITQEFCEGSAVGKGKVKETFFKDSLVLPGCSTFLLCKEYSSLLDASTETPRKDIASAAGWVWVASEAPGVQDWIGMGH